MEGERKYRQRGYQDSGREYSGNGNGARREERPRPQGPRPPIDVTGPRLPRMVQAVAAARCFNCSTASAGCRLAGELSQVQCGPALLQAMRAFRAVHPLSMPEAGSGADFAQGRRQRMRAVQAAGNGGARCGASEREWRCDSGVECAAAEERNRRARDFRQFVQEAELAHGAPGSNGEPTRSITVAPRRHRGRFEGATARGAR